MNSYRDNTLAYDPGLCSGCGLCAVVCPHRVFESGGGVAILRRPELCIECGACQRNCAPGAIHVRSGVGCASALLRAALFGGEAACCCAGQKDTCGATSAGLASCCQSQTTENLNEGEPDGEGRCA